MGEKIIPVVLAVIKEGNKFLLTKRVHSDKRYHDKWQFPGGELEHGEKLEEALNREIKEELGTEIKIVRFLGSIFTPIRNDWHGILIPYLCKLKDINSKIILNHEASEFRWFTLQEISKLNLMTYCFEIAKLA